MFCFRFCILLNYSEKYATLIFIEKRIVSLRSPCNGIQHIKLLFRHIHFAVLISLRYINSSAISPGLSIDRHGKTKLLNIAPYRSFGNAELVSKISNRIISASAQRYCYFVTTFCVPNCLTSLMSMAVYQLKRTEPVRFKNKNLDFFGN
nr:MAG TPA: hypothetical protein [Caudoviricetes sp.]